MHLLTLVSYGKEFYTTIAEIGSNVGGGRQPVGLRSLAPGSSEYRPYFTGGPLERDSAYHQGTVWGWLIGPFVEAHYKVYGDKEKAIGFLQPLAAPIEDYGLGSLAEVYDATEPFKPGGCIAQAWSVSEALRMWRMLNG